MPKAITLGNGNILVGLDRFGQVRDFYFPYVGLENQVGGHYLHRVGAYCDNQMAWLDDPSWEVKVKMREESLSSDISASNRDLGVSMLFTDVVYNEKNIFIRRVTVKNLRGAKKEIKIFFGHQFELYESHRAHTSYYDPSAGTIIHYRGKRVFLLNARLEGLPFNSFSTGVFHSEGKEGTHKDAEDGQLSGNAIEHGLADSVIGLSAEFEAGEEKTIYYWACAGKSIRQVKKLNNEVLAKSPAHMIKTTQDYWRAWINRQNFSFQGLSPEIISLFKKSLFITRAHADHKGAIIASSDSDMMQQGGKDNYCYMWPRDASFTAMALDRAGDFNVCQRYFEFCHKIISEEGYFMHKYGPDGSLGSSWHGWLDNKTRERQLPIQEDETASVIFALWKHYELTKDLEFIELVYNSLIKKAAEFMVSYRDEKNKLPLPSNDLWEEKYGTHTYTAASVYGALMAASRFAEILGKAKSQSRFAETAEEIKNAVLKNLYGEKEGYFYKSLDNQIIDSSSAYGVFFFGLLPLDDMRLKKSFEKTESELSLRTAVGGIARYKGDQFYRTAADAPGNPWIVTTIWLAEYYISRARNGKELERAKEILSWVTKRVGESGVLPEQIHPYNGQGLSAAPLVWSHAAFINAVISYLDKMEELGLCVACDPLNLPIKEIKLSIPAPY